VQYEPAEHYNTTPRGVSLSKDGVVFLLQKLEDDGEEAVMAPTFMPRLSDEGKCFHIEWYRNLQAGNKPLVDDVSTVMEMMHVFNPEAAEVAAARALAMMQQQQQQQQQQQEQEEKKPVPLTTRQRKKTAVAAQRRAAIEAGDVAADRQLELEQQQKQRDEAADRQLEQETLVTGTGGDSSDSSDEYVDALEEKALNKKQRAAAVRAEQRALLEKLQRQRAEQQQWFEQQERTSQMMKSALKKMDEMVFEEDQLRMDDALTAQKAASDVSTARYRAKVERGRVGQQRRRTTEARVARRGGRASS
jgi:hypothetical protein